MIKPWVSSCRVAPVPGTRFCRRRSSKTRASSNAVRACAVKRCEKELRSALTEYAKVLKKDGNVREMKWARRVAAQKPIRASDLKFYLP